MRWSCVSPALLGVLLFPLSVEAAANGKKLIEWGADSPDTAFLRQNVAQMEASPFDGTVIWPLTNSGVGLGEVYWGVQPVSSAQMSTALADLQGAHFTRFTDNFLRLNITPYGASQNIDWFNDFTTIQNNSLTAAQLAKDGGTKGILFDTEQYTQQVFNYSLQRDKATKSYAQYAAQARQRGSEIMQAFQQGFPGLTVFLPLAQTYPASQANTNPANLPTVSYGLLAPFIDGMIDAATGDTKIVDGYESGGYPLSVAHNGVGAIDAAIDYMHEGVLPVVGADHAKYQQYVSAGMSTWMDYHSDIPGAWDPNRTVGNYFTPEDLTNTLEAKLSAVDEYAWLYTERVKWWTGAGGPENISPAYYAAVQSAVPEPSTSLLIMFGAFGALGCKRGIRQPPRHPKTQEPNTSFSSSDN